MPILALPQLTTIPKIQEPHSLQLDYPIRRSPTSHSLLHMTPLDDISTGRSQVHLTFHLLQADGAVDCTTQYEVDRLSKWSHLIGDIERTVGTMGGFHILKIQCEDGRDVRRTIRGGEGYGDRGSLTE